MNCQLARNRILGVEEPTELPAELSGHLEGCESCRAWFRTFAQLDETLGQIPVPAAEGYGKAMVLERLRAIPSTTSTPAPRSITKPSVTSSANHKPLPAPMPMPVDLEEDLPKKKFAFGPFASKYWPAGLVAATLLIGVIAWVSLKGGKPQAPEGQPADPLLESVVQLNVELAKTNTPIERVEVLTKLADELNQQMRDIARADGTGENMQVLEQMYRRVVLQGLMAQAKLVERSQRELLLGRIADNLAQAGQKADQTAAEAPEHSAVRLREAAATAREGTKQIRALIREASL